MGALNLMTKLSLIGRQSQDPAGTGSKQGVVYHVPAGHPETHLRALLLINNKLELRTRFRGMQCLCADYTSSVTY